jgi:type IV secretory pathway VirB4 component
MVSIREYPAQTGPGSFDNLLRVPHEFIATQSFAIVDRPEAAKQIERVSRQVDMSDEAGSIVAEHLDDGPRRAARLRGDLWRAPHDGDVPRPRSCPRSAQQSPPSAPR